MNDMKRKRPKSSSNIIVQKEPKKKLTKPFDVVRKLFYILLALKSFASSFKDIIPVELDNSLRRSSLSLSHNTVVITTHGYYLCGSNESGQAGMEHMKKLIQFEKIATNYNIASISFGLSHSIAITQKGELLSSGYNYQGQLGTNSRTAAGKWKKVNDLTGVVLVSCGCSHSVALTSKGRVYVTGNNESGQLGLGDYESRSIFERVPSIKDIVSLSCGATHSYLLDREGSLYSCGSNDFGQLGFSPINNESKRNSFKLVPFLPESGRVVAIESGLNHVLTLTTTGCGCNFSGQLGIGVDNVSFSNSTSNTLFRKIAICDNDDLDIISIGCGGHHSVILSRQGDLFVCGSNEYGQLGLGDDITRHYFAKVTFNNESIPPFITSFKCGLRHTIIMKENGEVLSVGNNCDGQLGQTNSTQLPIFQRVGLRKTIML